jgi:hypothetical protein
LPATEELWPAQSIVPVGAYFSWIESVKPARGSSRSRTGGARHDDEESKRLPVRVTNARLDALIAMGYLAANKREDGPAVEAALQAFLAKRLGGHLH